MTRAGALVDEDSFFEVKPIYAPELIVGFGTANGDFAFPAGSQVHPTVPGVGWQPYDQKFVGDVNGDGKADIVWTNASSDARIFVALSP